MVKTNDRIEEMLTAALAAPYARVLWKEPDGSWGAKVLEFPGCHAAGPTLAATMEHLEAAMEDWASYRLERGATLPPPIQEAEPQARFSLNLLPAVRRRAAELAAAEGVSLNRWLADVIATATIEPVGRSD